MPSTIVCPSGLAGEIRGLKGKEGKLLADRNAARAGSTFEKLLAGCWLETHDPGVYELAEGAPPDWAKVLVADRFFTLLQIRSLTFGDEYAFSVQCKSASCRERFEWELSLNALPVRTLSDEAKAAFKAGNRFETKLPRDGRRRSGLSQQFEDPHPQRVPEHLQGLDVLDHVHRLRHLRSLEGILAWTIKLVQAPVNPPALANEAVCAPTSRALALPFRRMH